MLHVSAEGASVIAQLGMQRWFSIKILVQRWGQKRWKSAGGMVRSLGKESSRFSSIMAAAAYNPELESRLPDN